jgi:hypothetical protein
LAKIQVENLIDEHSRGFVGEAFDVQVKTGPVFTPMTLSTHIFKPKDEGLLGIYRLRTNDEEEMGHLTRQYSAPIGIMCLTVSDMKARCREHIEEMILNPYYSVQTTTGDQTEIPYLILEAVGKYYSATDNVCFS